MLSEIEILFEDINNTWENGLNDINLMLEDSKKHLIKSIRLKSEHAAALSKRNIAYATNILTMDYKASVILCTEAVETLAEVGDVKNEGTVLDLLSILYYNLSDYNQALKSTYQAVEKFIESGYERGLAWANYNLGMIYAALNDYPRAERYYTMSIEQFDKISHDIGRYRVRKQLGVLFGKIKRYDCALELLYQGSEIMQKMDSALSSEIIIDIGSLYRKKGLYNKAKKYFENARKVSKYNNKFINLYLEFENAVLLFYMQNYNEAEQELIKVLETAKKHEQKNYIFESEEYLYKLYKEQGKFDLALEYLEFFQYSKQETFNEENSIRIRNLEINNEIKIAKKEIEVQKKLQEETERILLNILPHNIVKELREHGKVIPKNYDDTTVLFTDFVGFTAMSNLLSPAKLINELDSNFTVFDKLVQKHDLEKLKTIGDGYMAVSNLTISNKYHTLKTVLVALEMKNYIYELMMKKTLHQEFFWNVRIGIHVGDVIAGIIGENKFAYDIWGDTVNIASRMESAGEPGKINISQHAYEKIKDFIDCEYRGEIEVKGKGKLKMYYIDKIKPEFSSDNSGIFPNQKLLDFISNKKV